MPKRDNTNDYTITGLNPLDVYLRERHYTRYKLSASSGLSQQLLRNVSKRKVDNIEAKFFVAIGKLIHEKPGKVMEDMFETQERLDKYLAIEKKELEQKDNKED